MKRASQERLFVWEESGLSVVARFGNLSASVRKLGSVARGDVRWKVGDVFGQHHLGAGWTPWKDVAIAEAERLILREAKALWPAVKRSSRLSKRGVR